MVERLTGQRLRHAIRAAKAAGIGLAAMAGSLFAERLLLESSDCRNAPGWGCLGVAVLWSCVLSVLSFLLSWAALRALRVQPAWLTALLGSGLGWYLVRTVTVVQWLPSGAQYIQLAMVTAAFALAAWFTQSRKPLWPRAAVAIALALLGPLNSVAVAQASQSSQDRNLAGAGVALLGPQLPTGYHFDGVGTEASMGLGATFFYRISPDSLRAGSTTMGQMQQEIQVIVGPVQPGFTPPSHCAALTSVYPVPSPACTPVAPGVWRWSNHHYVEYFTRVGDAVAVLQASTPPVSDVVLEELAATMRVCAASYFTGA